MLLVLNDIYSECTQEVGLPLVNPSELDENCKQYIRGIIKGLGLYCLVVKPVLPLYTFLKALYFFLRKTTFYTFFYTFFRGNYFFYTFFLPKMVNLVIEDSSGFTFRDLMSLRG